jgi:nitroimidazol reductase NimA-like FMN-containing flavoprotein (pyridoxamine 5'-phosphate oxidase superfamily)
MNSLTEDYTPTERSHIRLMRKRGTHDRATIYKILDSALMCNIGYVIDGQPYVTPTAFWREHNHIYWHGSSASRALNTQSNGMPVCLTVAHIDGLVMARSAFFNSVNYRAVMAFGRVQLVEGLEAKRRAIEVYINRFYPARTDSCRAATDKELGATKILVMDIEEASAKVRVGQPQDADEDYALPIWGGTIDFKTIIQAISPDPRNLAGVTPPPAVAHYKVGHALDTVLSRIYDGDNPPK